MRFISIFLSLSILSGCYASSPEELDRLMKEDPKFKQTIQTRDKLRGEIRAIKQEMLNKKKTVDIQTGALRRDYESYAKEQNLKIEKYQAMIEAERQALKKEIESDHDQLDAKGRELEGYEKTLSDVKGMLEGRNIRLSPQEKEKWQERILMLSEKMRPLTEEIQELKLRIRLKKQKIGFLR